VVIVPGPPRPRPLGRALLAVVLIVGVPMLAIVTLVIGLFGPLVLIYISIALTVLTVPAWIVAFVLLWRNTAPIRPGWRFNPPPGWPPPPTADWAPPYGWQPDVSWPPPPSDWQWWVRP
jgi:hypothetical protein